MILIIFSDKSFGQKNNWKHFSTSQFPAYVQEIEFPGGALISSNSSVSFGSWTVRVNNSAMPIMVGYNGNSVYTIYNMMEHNDVAGDFPCIIYYIDGATFGKQKRGIHEYQWNLGILQEFWNPSNYVSDTNHPNFYNNGIISIPFPVTIKLK